VDSNKITEAAFGFGTSTRDHAAKVFLSAEQAKVFFGLESPGPAAYKVLSGVGAQKSSRNRTAPGYSIPKEQRLKYDYVERAKRLPGAGLYDRPGAGGAAGGGDQSDAADGRVRDEHQGPRREGVPG
jgi:hypothetical protein